MRARACVRACVRACIYVRCMSTYVHSDSVYFLDLLLFKTVKIR